MKIYADGKEYPIREALEIITSQWVNAGESCPQTTIDLRRACEALIDAVDEFIEAGKTSFLTAHSCGIEKRYEVVAKFKTMQEMHAFYNAIIQLGQLRELSE